MFCIVWKPLANEVGAYDGISMVFNILASEILFADPLALYGYRDRNVLNKRGSHVFFIFSKLTDTANVIQFYSCDI